NELAIRSRRVGEPDIPECEAGIPGNRLLEETATVGRAQPFEEIAAVDIQLACLFRRGGNRNLIALRRRLRGHDDKGCTRTDDDGECAPGDSLEHPAPPKSEEVRPALAGTSTEMV